MVFIFCDQTIYTYNNTNNVLKYNSNQEYRSVLTYLWLDYTF